MFEPWASLQHLVCKMRGPGQEVQIESGALKLRTQELQTNLKSDIGTLDTLAEASKKKTKMIRESRTSLVPKHCQTQVFML